MRHGCRGQDHSGLSPPPEEGRWAGDEEVSWLGVVDRGAFPAGPEGPNQWRMPRSRRLQLRGQRRYLTGFPVSSRAATLARAGARCQPDDRPARRPASSGSWVTRRVGKRHSAACAKTKLLISRRSAGSSLAKGSSRRRARGLGEKSAEQGDASALAAGQRRRVARCEHRRARPSPAPPRCGAGARPGHARSPPSRKRGSRRPREMREEQIVLKENATRRRSAGTTVTSDPSTTTRPDAENAGSRKAADEREQRRLADAARSHHGRDAAGGDVEIERRDEDAAGERDLDADEAETVAHPSPRRQLR